MCIQVSQNLIHQYIVYSCIDDNRGQAFPSNSNFSGIPRIDRNGIFVLFREVEGGISE